MSARISRVDIGIIGYGRFGQFAAKRLQEDFRVVVYDPRRVRCSKGVHRGTLEEVATRPVLLLCVPISAISVSCLQIKPYLTPGQLIIDTCSVKEKPLQEMARLLPKFVEILGTHPLFGPDSARNGIRGLTIVLCPVRCRRVSKIKSWLERKGLKVFVTTPAKHDLEMAKTQALFHFLARGMAETGIRVGRLSTPGPAKLFDDFRDVRNDSLQLFQDLHRLNRYAPAVRKQLIACLTRLDAELGDVN
ncbi:MAG: prephenate dehydrogenase [Acidimicrobiia bacterium]|nr:prephenate dehydrogenase [Acidimicrobiia bacterium]